MAISYFDKYRAQAAKAGVETRTQESYKWFIEKMKSLRTINRTNILRDPNLIKKNKPMAGRMYMYFYDPKTKDTLPYYDRFPLIVMIGPAPGGFYGLNFHYLPPPLRAKLLDGLLDITNNKKYDESTRIRLSYGLLTSVRKLRWFEPCFKRYLLTNIKRQMVMVEASEWETAVFLPTEDFAKANKRKVWRDSKATIGSV